MTDQFNAVFFVPRLFAACLLAAISVSACNQTEPEQSSTQPTATQTEDQAPVKATTPDIKTPDSISAPTDIAQPRTGTVTIRTNDTSVRIIRLSSPWGDIEADGVGTTEITYKVTGEENGIECKTDQLWVYTSDGQIFAPKEEICDTWKIELNVSPPPFDASQMQLLPDDMIWQHFSSRAEDEHYYDSEFLALAIPETDAGLIWARCKTGTEWIDLDLHPGMVPATDETSRPPKVDFAVGGDQHAKLFHFQTFWTAGSQEGMDYNLPSLREHVSNPLFAKLVSDAPMMMMIEGQPPFRKNGPDESGAIKDFIAACGA